MYFLISTGAIASVISWYLASYSFFMISVATTIIIATYTGFLVYNKDTFIHQCVFVMQKTECCCVHKLWSDPKSVIWSTNFIKTTAGILAAVAIQNSWQYAKAFKDGSYITVTLLWILTVVLWFLSSVPTFICLIQCAAIDGKKPPNPIHVAGTTLTMGQKITVDDKHIKMVDGKTLIIRFRKVKSLELLHDVVIGIFWLYLILTLYDLIDDDDDSEWRTIFLSMMSWHIVFVTLYHIYLKQIRSCVHITRAEKSRPCCAPSEADKWWSITQLLGFAAIYIAIIWRMKEPTLTDMGCSEETLGMAIFGILLWALGKKMEMNAFRGTISENKPKDIFKDNALKGIIDDNNTQFRKNNIPIAF